MTECDIKKIIALSTLRQLGIIIIATMGLGIVNLEAVLKGTDDAETKDENKRCTSRKEVK